MNTSGSRFPPAGPVSDQLRLSTVGYADARVQTLVAQVQSEYVAMYGSPDETPVDPADFDPPTGAFLIGEINGVPIACGGWRRIAHAVALTAEIKRMFVSVPARRAGVARSILAELERGARASGYRNMVLETGSLQPAAVQMYRAAGYGPTPGYGYYRCNPSSITLGKAL